MEKVNSMNINIIDKNYKFLTSKDTGASVIRGLKKINIFVGPNNSGKSRFLRSLLFQRRSLNRSIPDEYKCVYIPMLRGLRKLGSEHGDEYLTRTENDYQMHGKEIFTGLSFYKDIKELRSGSHAQRQRIKGFEDFLSKEFFNKKDIALTPKEGGGVNIITLKIGDDKDMPIHDLGDGMQSLIIATFPLFKYVNNRLLLVIEEPELTLHPGLQRKLLNIYCDNDGFPDVNIFMTTHSNHLIDLSLDYEKHINIYSTERTFRKQLHPSDLEKNAKLNNSLFEELKGEGYINQQGDITKKTREMTDSSDMREDLEEYYNKIKYIFYIKNITPNKEILDFLGVRNSSVFLSNCIIWLEGISDRIYVREFLRMYFEACKSDCKKYEEDKHYSFVEYGGSNLSHFNFNHEDQNFDSINVDSISKNNFLMADHDGKKKGKRTEMLKELKKIFGDKFFDKHREIEHLIPFNVYKEYLKRQDISVKKDEATKFNEELKGTSKPIGDILRKYFDIKKAEKEIRCIGPNKKTIALGIIEVIRDLDLKFTDFGEEAKDLTCKLYKFIKKNNTM